MSRTCRGLVGDPGTSLTEAGRVYISEGCPMSM